MKLGPHGKVLVEYVISFANDDIARWEFDLDYSGYVLEHFPGFQAETPRLAAKFAQTVDQACESYDTATLSLYQRNETLRIRIKSGKQKLEYKYNKRWQEGCRICNEKSISIKNTPKEIAQSDALALGIADAPLEKLGSLVTKRINFHIDKLIVSLDYNCYQGKKDFEFEIESPTTIIQWENYFNSLPIDFSKPVEGKYTRFIRQLNYQSESTAHIK